jgi:hypothetical protein
VITDAGSRPYLTLFFGLVGPISNLFTAGLVRKHGSKNTIVYGGTFLAFELLLIAFLSN